MAEPFDPRQARERRIRVRNWAMLAVLVGLVLLFYAISIVRMSGS
jgi:hypothetical protein